MGRPVDSSDLVDLDKKLRVLMSEFDRAGYLLEASFTGTSPALEVKAVAARPVVRAAAGAIEEFLKVLEKTPEYRAQRG